LALTYIDVVEFAVNEAVVAALLAASIDALLEILPDPQPATLKSW
jgi:hypothetical protein